MASIRKQVSISSDPDAVWDAVADLGALHTRLVPGFVLDTRLEPGARVVTFANGMIIREPVVSVDHEARRLVWSAEAATLSHYNASVQVFIEGAGSRVVWIADFLPDEAAAMIEPMMGQGLEAMQRALGHA
jgi:carbon monoxide dehydrogenase subunit G